MDFYLINPNSIYKHLGKNTTHNIQTAHRWNIICFSERKCGLVIRSGLWRQMARIWTMTLPPNSRETWDSSLHLLGLSFLINKEIKMLLASLGHWIEWVNTWKFLEPCLTHEKCSISGNCTIWGRQCAMFGRVQSPLAVISQPQGSPKPPVREPLPYSTDFQQARHGGEWQSDAALKAPQEGLPWWCSGRECMGSIPGLGRSHMLRSN